MAKLKKTIKLKNVEVKKPFIFSSTIFSRRLKNKQDYKKDPYLKATLERLLSISKQKYSTKLKNKFINHFSQNFQDKREIFYSLKKKMAFDSSLLNKIINNENKVQTIKEISNKYRSFFPKLKFSNSSLYRWIKQVMKVKFCSCKFENAKIMNKDKDLIDIIFIEKYIELISKEHVIFYLDEASFNEHKNSKKFWVTDNSEKLKINSGRIKSISVMSIISESGICHFETTRNKFNADIFLNFINKVNNILINNNQLKEKLLNGQITVIIDNSRVHSSKSIIKELFKQKINILFQPVYRPIYNSTELLWSIAKKHMNKFSFNSM